MSSRSGQSVATSTIAQPVGSQTRPTILTRSLVALRQVSFNADSLSTPQQLYAVIHALQQNVLRVVRVLAANPLLGANHLTGWTFTANQTQNIPHRLGRPWQGYIVCRAQVNPASFIDAPYPPGTNSSQLLPLTSANAGTYDFLVF